MIKQSTVLMVTPLAMLAANKGVDLDGNASDVIKGLNQTTGAVTEYNEDNIAVALPDVTAKSGDHTEVLDATTDIIAAHVRSALSVISKHVKPILKEVEDRIRNEMSGDNAVESIFSHVRVEMVNIEPSFFNSPFYPKDIPAAFKDTMSIKLGDLLKGTYPTLSGVEVKELIAVDVDELRGFFADAAELERVYNSIFVEKNWYYLFDGSAVSNGVVNISNAETYVFNSFRTLVIASMLATKLVAMQDPLPGVTGVGLEDYRQSLIMTREMISAMLVRFRQIWEARAAAGVVILDNDVKMGNGAQGTNVEVVNRNPVSAMMLTGKITVGYNNAVLRMFAQAEDMSLSEFAVGYVYAKHRGYRVKDIISDKELIVDAWKEYLTDVRSATSMNKTTVASQILVQVLAGLYANEKYKDFIDSLPDEVAETQRILQRMRARVDVDKFFGDTEFLNAVIKGQLSLMNTRLAAVLAGAFDSPLAEEILTANAQNKPGSVEHQRKCLTKSITKIIVNRLLVG